jgi:hypothetical protein
MIQEELPLDFNHLVTCSAARQDDPNHHLRQKPNGYWQLRCMVDRGPKFVGIRVVIGLRTRCAKEARERRDLILKSYEIAHFKSTQS